MSPAETTPADAIALLAGQILTGGVVGLNLHGNISVREEGADYIWMTGSSLRGLSPQGVFRVSMNGEPLDEGMRQTEEEVVRMHTAVYRERDDAGCVIHTHAPHATAHAVASRALPCVAESMARQGYCVDVPVAAYAPRGSQESVAAIVECLRSAPDTPAVLLESHGVLVFGSSPDVAFRRLLALEEGAQLATLATNLGGARGLTRSEADAARFR